jgi:hypothetical protein
MWLNKGQALTKEVAKELYFQQAMSLESEGSA